MIDTVRAGGLKGYRHILRGLGEDPEAILQQCGISAAMLTDPDRYIPYRNVLKAIEYPAEELGIADFGLRLADQQSLDFLGALSLALQSAASVREALLLIAKFLYFHTPGAVIDIQPSAHSDKENVLFRFVLPGLPLMPQSTQHAVFHLMKLVRVLSAGTIAPADIFFRHKRVSSNAVYIKYLGKLPEFEALHDGIALNIANIRRPLPQSNPMLLDITQRFIMGVTPQADLPIEAQIRDVLTQLIRMRPVGLIDVASALSLHPRTLQRRLKAQGARFESIRDTVRKDYFTELIIQDRLPLAHIALMLGYADQSVLNRSCWRWFGKTPLAVRKALA